MVFLRYQDGTITGLAPLRVCIAVARLGQVHGDSTKSREHPHPCRVRTEPSKVGIEAATLCDVRRVPGRHQRWAMGDEYLANHKGRTAAPARTAEGMNARGRTTRE